MCKGCPKGCPRVRVWKPIGNPLGIHWGDPKETLRNPTESGLGFETRWGIPRNGWDVPVRKRWDPTGKPKHTPHSTLYKRDFLNILVLSEWGDKNGEKGKMGEKGKRKESYNPIMLPMFISRRKRWGDSPAFFVRNVRRAFLFWHCAEGTSA